MKSWQAEAPAPRWPQWGRRFRFRLPTGAFNGAGAFRAATVREPVLLEYA